MYLSEGVCFDGEELFIERVETPWSCLRGAIRDSRSPRAWSYHLKVSKSGSRLLCQKFGRTCPFDAITLDTCVYLVRRRQIEALRSSKREDCK
jgi:hypothetical protein